MREDGIIGKEVVAVDGSKFKAVNSKDRNFSEAKLRGRIDRLETHIEEYSKELEANDGKENSGGEKSAEEINRIVMELSERKERYKTYVEELERTGETQKSLTDGDSRLMAANGKREVCCNVQAAVDAKNKLVVEFEVANAGTDHNQITPMVERAKSILGTETLAVAADAGYDSVQDIGESMAHGATPPIAGTDFDICVPAPESGAAVPTAHRNGRCVYIAGRNLAVCPMGKTLYPSFYKNATGQGVFSNREACKTCGRTCTKEKRGRRHQAPMAEEDFSKVYDDTGLSVKQMRIRPDKGIINNRRASSAVVFTP
jgi:hypothetical protein